MIYISGNIDDEEYTRETVRIKSQLSAAREQEDESKPVNLDNIREFLKSDFLVLYHSIPKEEQRRIWRSVIEEIYIEGTNVVGVKPRT